MAIVSIFEGSWLNHQTGDQRLSWKKLIISKGLYNKWSLNGYSSQNGLVCYPPTPLAQARVQANSNDVLLGTVHARPFSLPIEQHQQIRSRFGIKRFTFQPLNFGIVLVVVGYSTAKPHVVSSCCWLMHLHHQIHKKMISISTNCRVNPPFQLINVPIFQGKISSWG